MYKFELTDERQNVVLDGEANDTSEIMRKLCQYYEAYVYATICKRDECYIKYSIKNGNDCLGWLYIS